MTAAYQSMIMLLVSGSLLFHNMPTFGQDFASPEDEFDSIFTPLPQVEGSLCARYHNWNRKPFPLCLRISCFCFGTPTRPSPWQMMTG